MFEEKDAMKILPNGDRGLLVRFPGEVTPVLNDKILGYYSDIEKASIPGLIELVPSYNSITIYYEPTVISYCEISKKLYQVLQNSMDAANPTKKRIVHIPVLYGGEWGPDFITLSKEVRLPPKELIQLHTAPTYLVYMMGFLPGFPYMGGLDPRLYSPRLENPRINVPAGSVGIAHEQTGIYPIESPGGWKLIGRTPLSLFHPELEQQAFLFQTGDYVKFYEINEEAFHEIRHQQETNRFQVQIEERG